MTSRPLSNLAASVHQRLLNKAREADRPFNELLQYFAMERFLYRLSVSPHAGSFVLKGALMLTTWKVASSRPTMDIDLLGLTGRSLAAIVSAMKEVCLQSVPEDGLVFDANSAEGEEITEDADYVGVRIRFQGKLGNAHIPMQIDVGFGDVMTATDVECQAILDFPAPRLRGYTRESTIAEKFEAMVKFGILNSRMKDFFDIWALSRQFEFDGASLATAVRKTFVRRGTAVPVDAVALTERFANDPTKDTQWRAFVRRSRLADAPQKFQEVARAVADFIGPVARALSSGAAFRGRWKAGGPWRMSGGNE